MGRFWLKLSRPIFFLEDQMPKFIIFWDVGFGKIYEIEEAESQDKADEAAYEAWHREAESNAEYGAEPYSKELAKDYGLE